MWVWLMLASVLLSLEVEMKSALVLFLLVLSTSATATTPFVPGQVIVRFDKPTTLDQAKLELSSDARFTADQVLAPSLDIFLIKLSAGLSVEDALVTLRKNPRIQWAQANHLLKQRATYPGDPLFGQQWDMDQWNDIDIDAPEAWDFTVGGTNPAGQQIVVAVIDGGCQISHPELAPNLWTNPGEVPGNRIDDDGDGYIDDVHGWNVFSNSETVPPDVHGTHVCGTVGARGGNNRMICGVNMDVRIMAIAGAGNTAAVSAAYNFVITQKNRWWSSGGTQGANVVATNSSFGVDSANCASGDYPIWNNLYNAMGQIGILSAVATANRHWNVDITGDVPSACSSPYIVAVTNTTNTDQLNGGAAWGATNIDLGAPGTGILSTIPTDTAGFLSGTSMASPHVAGAIAFLHAAANMNFYNYYVADHANGALAIKQMILNNVDVIPALTGITVSNGRLNLYKAARAARHYGGPPNDDCPGIGITELPYYYNGTTATAVNDFFNCMGVNSRDVIFTMTLPCSTSVTASLCGSSYDTGIDIRTGGDGCPGGATIACNDDYCGNQSQVTFTAVPNQAYYIVVHGYGTNSGNYVLNVTGVKLGVANDVCPGKSITSLPYVDAGNTACAFNDYPYKCVGANSPEVFYTMTLPTCQTVTVSLCGSTFDTGLEVRSGGSCPGSTQVACSDDNCGLQSQVTFVAQSSVAYYILVHGYAANTGLYALFVTGTPFVAPNDNCPGTVVTSLPFTDYGNTRCATNSVLNCSGTAAPDVIYALTLPECETVIATLCGSGYDTRIDVRANGACPGETVVACNDDSLCGGSWSLQSTVMFQAMMETTYWIIVSGYNGESGPYALYISGGPYSPPNDACPGTVVSGFPFTDVGNTTCANNDYLNCVQGNAPEVVYVLNTAICRNVTVSLCGSSFDTCLEIRTNGACPGTTMVACEDDNLCIGQMTAQSVATFRATAFQDYFIIVHGYQDQAGPYTINVSGTYCSPEGLVIHQRPPRIYLHWNAVSGVEMYAVYRDTLPDVQINESNRIGNSDSTGYLDLAALNLSGTKFFYAVTAAIPQLIAEAGNKENVKAELSRRSSPDKSASLPQGVYVPAYAGGNTRYVPNPNK
jgi:subtilisin family serine protease